MLKPNVIHFIDALANLDVETRLTLAASMTQTLARHDIVNSDAYLYRLMRYYEDLGNSDTLERLFSRNPSCVAKE